MTDNQSNGESEDTKRILEKKIARQIEYYFGDHNLSRDKFLKQAIEADDGWVPLATLLTFNRLKTLSTDKELIIKALKDSPNKLIQVNEDGDKIRRSTEKPLPQESEDLKLNRESRSVYAKGFPTDTSLDAILEFFESHGSVENVYMRKFFNDKKFKGSVFALFSTVEEAEKFLKEPEVCFKGNTLLRESSKQYHERKALQSKKSKKNKEKANQQNEDESKDDNKSEDKTEEADTRHEMKVGCVLYLTGFGDGTSREDIKEVFDDHAKVAWVDFSRGDSEAWVRFEESGTASIALEKAKQSNDGKIEIKNSETTVKLVEGEEEQLYWKKFRELMQKLKEKKNQRGRGNNFRGKGKHGGRGGRRDQGGRWKGKKQKPNEEEKDESAKPKRIKFDSDSEEVSKSEESDKKRKLEKSDADEPSSKSSKTE